LEYLAVPVRHISGLAHLELAADVHRGDVGCVLPQDRATLADDPDGPRSEKTMFPAGSASMSKSFTRTTRS